jgi:hypothetical protein
LNPSAGGYAAGLCDAINYLSEPQYAVSPIRPGGLPAPAFSESLSWTFIQNASAVSCHVSPALVAGTRYIRQERRFEGVFAFAA